MSKIFGFKNYFSDLKFRLSKGLVKRALKEFTAPFNLHFAAFVAKSPFVLVNPPIVVALHQLLLLVLV